MLSIKELGIAALVVATSLAPAPAPAQEGGNDLFPLTENVLPGVEGACDPLLLIEDGWVMEVLTENLNVREAPGLSATIVGHVEKGWIATVTGESPVRCVGDTTWVYVTFAQVQDGRPTERGRIVGWIVVFKNGDQQPLSGVSFSAPSSEKQGWLPGWGPGHNPHAYIYFLRIMG